MVEVSIRDVTLRDGIQNERPIQPAARAILAVELAQAGLHDIEVASFVSPKAVPAMSHAAEVVRDLPTLDDVRWWALVPNARGGELALDAGVRNLTVTVSASEGYSQKNVGCSVDEALNRLDRIFELAGSDVVLDVVISCAFGSPFDDVANAQPTLQIVERALEGSPDARITVADTTGTATPRRLEVVAGALRRLGIERFGLHLHDTRGTALANALAAIDAGVTDFDTAVGGLGGSPFAPGAGGNLATEQLVMMLGDLGHVTGVALSPLLAMTGKLAHLIGHEVPSRVAAAGPLAAFNRADVGR